MRRDRADGIDVGESAISRLGELALRRKWQAAAAVAVLFAITSRPMSPGSDLDSFARTGQDILAGRWGRVYAGSWNQAGPLQLLLSRVLMLGATGMPVLAVRIAVDLLVLLALRALTTRCATTELATTAAVVMTTLLLGPWGLWFGHPAEMLIPLLWIGAGRAARHARALRAGLLLGAAMAIAPWAVLAAPTLLAGRLTVAARSVAVASAATAVAYGPFVLTGHFAMGQHLWPVSPYSLVHLIDPSAVVFSWTARLVQAAIVAAACAGVALALRSRPEGVLVAPLAAAVVRLLTDPLGFDYYWLPVGAAAITALAVIGTTVRRAVPFVGLSYLPWLAIAAGSALPRLPSSIAALYTLAVAAYTVTLFRSAGRQKPRTWVMRVRRAAA